ncbi:RNA 2',3'-cyclic phosphodiesterase [Halobaculum sp. CBA1158]|uniref:RNA 2',3'-cyclic phosphodiesterase n=1 Tax=Halobaculum sp. CBA1158 TaxID=2904243 RepID=UPI001F2A5081|nr:RNA 2',3'-cyclic phosphodiesterase [Halobaculum sp. CBA1158]UIO99992.1 RNA 2',3'-cyclic phosphodiesterase [Halobaculum sp. CBA1158]
MPRLFVSVDLPDRLADGVAALQDPLRDVPSLRFTDPEQAHVTLKFFGEVNESRVGDVTEALERAVASAARSAAESRTESDDAGVGPFDAEVGGLGVFPSREYVSVIWVGVREGEGAAELTRLAGAVERATVALGFDEADHEFTPHVTLARMDDARGKDRVLEYLETDPTVGRFEVDEIRLTESTLTEKGPEYETRARVSL